MYSAAEIVTRESGEWKHFGFMSIDKDPEKLEWKAGFYGKRRKEWKQWSALDSFKEVIILNVKQTDEKQTHSEPKNW